jgi:hypothetical protein
MRDTLLPGQLRRKNMQRRAREGDDRLVGSKYQWLRLAASFGADAWQKFISLLESSRKKVLGMGIETGIETDRDIQSCLYGNGTEHHQLQSRRRVAVVGALQY